MLRRASITLIAFYLMVLPITVCPQDGVRSQIDYRSHIELLRKSNPNQFAQLVARAKEFNALRPGEQRAIRDLHTKLNKQSPAKKKLLFRVMKKYSSWVQHLDAATRQEIVQASPHERFNLVRDIRQHHWIRTLAKVHREELKTLTGAERQNKIALLRKQQAKWHIEWGIARKHWDALVINKNKKKPGLWPKSLADLPKELRGAELDTFVVEFLYPQISVGQRKRLEAAEGHWPWYPYLLVQLTDKYPLALPGATKWPANMSELPSSVLSRLNEQRPETIAALKKVSGKWPDFVNEVSHAIDRQKPVPLRFDLWPATIKHLSLPVKKFLTSKLRPVLATHEKAKLEKAEGRWPDYPLTIQKLSTNHDLQVPWQTLPSGKKGVWESYRLKVQSD